MKPNATIRAAALIACLAGLVACTTPTLQPLMPTPVLFSELEVSPLAHIPEAERWKPRRVYYATTRARDDDLQRINYNNRETDGLSMGLSLIGFGDPDLSWSELAEVSRQSERLRQVPLSVSGLIEVGRIDLAAGAEAQAHRTESIGWLLADLNSSIAAARDRDLLIYVHGARVNFYNANVFAAQLDHFMGRDMTSLAFAWPTRQNLAAYGTGGDVRRAYRAADALVTLVELLAEASDARRIHIVAWSAGGRVVTSALQSLHARHGPSADALRAKLRIGTVYLAAADVPHSEFMAALPAINEVVQRVVVTLSSEDGALRSARVFMGGGSRIGERNVDLTPQELATVRAADRLEVVDVSHGAGQRGFDITGHRYWYDHPWASSDMILAVRSDLPPDERGLEQGSVSFLWGIPPDYPQRLDRQLRREGLRFRRD
jgi:esterase/lipase superfamily enzyme